MEHSIAHAPRQCSFVVGPPIGADGAPCFQRYWINGKASDQRGHFPPMVDRHHRILAKHIPEIVKRGSSLDDRNTTGFERLVDTVSIEVFPSRRAERDGRIRQDLRIIRNW